MDLMGRINSAGHLSRDQHGSTVSWWVTTPTNLPKQWRNGWIGWSRWMMQDFVAHDGNLSRIETKHYSMGLGTTFYFFCPWLKWWELRHGFFSQSWRKNPVGIPEYPSYKYFQVGAVWTFDVGNICVMTIYPGGDQEKLRLYQWTQMVNLPHIQQVQGLQAHIIYTWRL